MNIFKKRNPGDMCPSNINWGVVTVNIVGAVAILLVIGLPLASVLGLLPEIPNRQELKRQECLAVEGMTVKDCYILLNSP